MPLITLIPNSGVQFWDADIDIERLPRLSRSFWEEKLTQARAADGSVPAVLRPLFEKDGELIYQDGQPPPPPDDVYMIGRNQAIEFWMHNWAPLPFFRVDSAAAGREALGEGPTNWVRAHIAPLAAGSQHSHRLTLAFDTTLLPTAPGQPYAAPSPDDSRQQREFAFVPDIARNSGFLGDVWVGDWLREMLLGLRRRQRPGRPLREEDDPHVHEHYARYLVMLELLDMTGLVPRLRLLDVVSENLGYVPVAVDLVLDIGNARTCGILIEEHAGQGMNLSDSYPLALRDLSRPECLHSKPFDSRVEFARASFGPDAISRRSGRASAFAWPSPVRVGPEAERLAGARLGNEGATSLSSPKRYLWDERPSTQVWRFNGRATDGAIDPAVGGAFMALVSEDGTVLRHRAGTSPAVRARFSRSSIFTFMLAELLLQAVGQMNAPGTRAQRRDADKPRQLRSLMMTMPPGMPVAEQRILRSRAEAAVKLAWDMLGWKPGTPHAPPQPMLRANLDEATATQIVWLHNEVTERLQGDAAGLMELLGRVRPEVAPAPCLRVASIDIGGGTTDLMVATYTMQGGEAISPKQEFRESFKIAGDDVLERVITGVVVPAIATALTASGVRDARAVLSRALGQDQGGQSEQERHLRRLFVATVLEPAGIAVLSAYEQLEGRTGGQILSTTLGEMMDRPPADTERAFAYLDHAARDAGAPDFRVAGVALAVDARHVEPLIAAVLGPVLADLCEVVWHYDCDVLLLSGRPSRLRIVGDMVLAKAPVPPHRIVGMHRYRVGEKYPFRDAANRIDDPKTTAAVGAALCVQAQGRLRNFLLQTNRLSMRSTARYIGRMDNNGQIRDENVLLSNVDLDGPPAQDVGFTVPFQTLAQLGFRQLPIERWTATPLYVMEFANPDTSHKMELPLRVKVIRKEIDPDAERDQAGRETFNIEEVEDSGGGRLSNRDVRLRLQTIDDGDGYWRDTGRLALQ